MDLIKHNPEKGRSVFFDKDSYVKTWNNKSPLWIKEHVSILNNLFPYFVIDHGTDYIRYNVIKGTPASKFEHTDEFIRKIYKFCLSNIKQTKPYVHGDWVLSNIIIDNDKMTMIDWDNIGIYPEQEYMDKLHRDLESAFGKERFRGVINDTTSI